MIDDYAARGYDFLMISDHDIHTSPEDYAALDARGLVLIPGNEITRRGQASAAREREPTDRAGRGPAGRDGCREPVARVGHRQSPELATRVRLLFVPATATMAGLHRHRDLQRHDRSSPRQPVRDEQMGPATHRRPAGLGVCQRR